MLDRRTLLCQQALPPELTGVDFVQVLDHTVQDTLHVYFIVDPAIVEDGGGAAAIPEAAALTPAVLDDLDIISTAGGDAVEIIRAEWLNVIVNGITYTVLEVEVDEPGDFTLYRFTYDHPAMDRFFQSVTFSFKQACPTGRDCKGCEYCDPPELKETRVDYLARDWSSLRRALLDYAGREYPEWEHQVEADQAMMHLEILAALGDEFAYLQDRYALEAYLPTATQTQSILNLASLVDYKADRGQSATTLLTVFVRSGAAQYTLPGDPAAGSVPDRAWAAREDVGAIPFEVTERVYVHPRWNEAPFFQPDQGTACLEVGATEVYLSIRAPDGTIADEDPGDVALANPFDIWLNRRIVLRSGVGVPEDPDRAWAVTITEVEPFVDPLDPLATPLTRIAWDVLEALPFQMPFASGIAYFNTVSAIAGETLSEIFRVGDDAALLQRFGAADSDQQRILTGLPKAIERQGACEAGVRGRVVRFGLSESPERGVGWVGNDPDMRLFEIDPDLAIPAEVGFAPDMTSPVWEFVPQIIDADPGRPAFTLESGIWREVRRFHKPGGDVVHAEYAGNDGMTIRYGDRGFGLPPVDATVFHAIYRTAPGIAANVPPDTVTFTARPATDEPSSIAYAERVTNPFAVTSARAPESVDSIRANAPEAWRAILLRAVRSEDYREILERRDDLQAARVTARWTGSWMTDIAAVDPAGTTTLSDALRLSVPAELDCIRQAGRDVCLRDPWYIPIDIRVDVCVEPTASNEKVIRRVTKALTDFREDDAFFHPDQLSFGDDLIRSKLEAAIQCIDGVRAVERIEIRRRGLHDFLPLPARIEIAPHQILQLSNDPAHPEQGSLEVSAHGGG